MADRIDLLVSLGALLKDAERRGDGSAVQTLHDAMEAIVEASGVVAVLERRRKSDRERKRDGRSHELRASAESTESTESGGIHGNGGPPSLSVPLLPPTPPNNSSTLSPPASSSAAPAAGSPEFDAEQRLLARLDDDGTAAVLRFLGRSGSDIRRAAWVGRLGALMDRPPHFTPAELSEGLEALMTEPEDSWKPSVLKAWVRRVRSDATREAEKAAERAAQPPSRNGQRVTGEAGSDAGSMFAAIRTLVETVHHPSAGTRKVIPRAKVAELGERALKAYDNIGGADRFLADEKVGLVLRDFTREYGTFNGAHP